MKNTNNRKNNQTEINTTSCNGGIYKTYKESFMQRFHLKSERSDLLLKPNPTAIIDGVRTNLVVVQMVICGNMEVMAEIIRKEDFDKYFNEEE